MASTLPAIRLLVWTALRGLMLPRLASGGRRPRAPGDVAVAGLAWMLACATTSALGVTGVIPLVALAAAAAALAGWPMRGLALPGLEPGPRSQQVPTSAAAAVRDEMALPWLMVRASGHALVAAASRRGGLGASVTAAGVCAVVVSGAERPVQAESHVAVCRRALDALSAGPSTTAGTTVAIVLSAWSGAALLRRMNPRASAAWGALSLGLPMSVGLLWGMLSPADALCAAIVPWTLVPLARARRLRDVWALPVAAGLLSPPACAAAVCVIAARRASIEAPGAPAWKRHAWVSIAVASAVVAAGLWRSAGGALADPMWVAATVATCGVAALALWRARGTKWRARRWSEAAWAVAAVACAMGLVMDGGLRRSGLLAVAGALGAVGCASGASRVWSRSLARDAGQRNGTTRVSPARRRT